MIGTVQCTRIDCELLGKVEEFEVVLHSVRWRLLRAPLDGVSRGRTLVHQIKEPAHHRQALSGLQHSLQ